MAKRREQVVDSEESVPIPALSCVTPVLLRDWTMGIGPRHVVSYKEGGNKKQSMTAWEYEIDDDAMSVSKQIKLKNSIHFEDGPLPIVEVSDTHVFRADFNGTIYIWSLETGDLVFHSACCKQEGDMVAVYKPRAATHTSMAIIVISSPREDCTVVGVCMNWFAGNSDFLFFDSNVPLITSITPTYPTQFLMTSAIGLCSLNISIPDIKTWAIVPYTRVNAAFVVEDDVQLMTELVPVSKFHAQMLKWIESFMSHDKLEESNVTEAVRQLKHRPLPKQYVPHHVRQCDGLVYMVSDACLTRINEVTRELTMYTNEAKCKTIACLGVEGAILSVTVEGDIYLHADNKFSITPATAFTAKGRGLYQIEVRPSSPNNGIIQQFGKYIYVNIYQKHIFPFYLEKKESQVGGDELELDFHPRISGS